MVKNQLIEDKKREKFPNVHMSKKLKNSIINGKKRQDIFYNF